MKITIPLVMRLYVAGKLELEEKLQVPERRLEAFIPSIAEKYAKLIADRPFMVEIEFLTQPPATRFFRFGTDKQNMVDPLKIDLEDLKGKPQ